MRMPQIRLEQTYARIGMDIIKPQQRISQPQAELNLHQEPAVLDIERTPSHLDIDQSQAWNDLNIKDMYTMTRDIADYAHQQVLEGIARRAREGDRLAAIEKGGNPIADIAQENANPGPLDFNVGVLPSYGAVKIQFTPTQLQMNWKRGGVTIDPLIKQPTHEYIPGKVEVYLKQKESLKIDFTDPEVDMKL